MFRIKNMRKKMPRILVYLLFSLVLTSIGTFSFHQLKLNTQIADCHTEVKNYTEAFQASVVSYIKTGNPLDQQKISYLTPIELNEKEEEVIHNDEGNHLYMPTYAYLIPSSLSITNYGYFESKVLGMSKVSLIVLFHSWKSHLSL